MWSMITDLVLSSLEKIEGDGCTTEALCVEAMLNLH